MTLAEKIWGSSIGAFIAYGKTAAAAALKPLLVTDNGDGTGTLVVNTNATALPTDASTHTGQDELKALIGEVQASPTSNTVLDRLKSAVTHLATIAGFVSGGHGQVDVLESALPTGAATESTLSDIKTAVEGSLTAKIDQTTPGTTNKVVAAIDQATANANEVVVKSITAGDPKLGTLVDGQSPVVAGYKTKRVNVVFTGMDATAQYDAVGALVEIPNWATANGRSATIREIRMSCNNNAIAPQFEIHFYRAADVTVAADNASWTELAAEYDKRAGYILMPAMAKPAGSGTIDLVRCQNDDYGNGMSKEVTCAAGSTSIWAKLKLMTSGIAFAGTPGNTIVAAMVIEQS